MNNDNQNPIIQPTSPQNVVPTPGPDQQKPRNKGLLIVLLTVGFIAVIMMVSLGTWALQQNSTLELAQTNANKLERQNKTLSRELAERKTSSGENNINKESHQAVFLKTGQVYFGKITKLTETQLTLENIYYLKAGSGAKPTTAAEVANPTGDVSLVKLGGELHGPEDVMYIERKEVTFWENLKTDSKVSKAIKQFETQN